MQAITPILFEIISQYLVGMKRRTSRSVACKRDNSHFLLNYEVTSPEAKIVCRVRVRVRASIVYPVQIITSEVIIR